MNMVPNPSLANTHSNMKVKELIDANGREWNMDKLSTLFPEQESKLIEEIMLGRMETEDS